ncbi:MAG: Omp28-related outer membrane protein [Bacteroidia bacterium]
MRRLPVTGLPNICINFFDAWTNTKTLQGMKDNINSKITEHNAAAVVANSALSYSVENDKIVVKTTTKFFQNVDEYNISVLVLEDGVIANQAGPNGGPNASHHKVLRASNEDWGVTIVDGAKSAGSLVEQEISITKDPSWNMENVEIATVI